MKVTVACLVFSVISDVLTSRVSFRIVNKNFNDDLSDPGSASYSDMQITIQRNVSLFVNFLVHWWHKITIHLIATEILASLN